MGGGVNAVTRSGSNQFHGDAFEYYRDNDFGATNPFNTLAVQVPGAAAGVTQTIFIKPKDKRHQYGGTFSGPLIHDKLFFLYSFDQQKRNFPVLATPTPQFLAAGNSADNNCKILGSTTGAITDAITCAVDRGVSLAQVNSAMAYVNGQSGVAPRFLDLRPHALGLAEWDADQSDRVAWHYLDWKRLREGRFDYREARHDDQPNDDERTPAELRADVRYGERRQAAGE
jgi:hypothetical protein